MFIHVTVSFCCIFNYLCTELNFFYVVLEKDGEVLHTAKEERNILHAMK